MEKREIGNRTKLNWGKPKIEISESLDGAPVGEWKEVPIVKEGTAILTTTKGNKTDAKGEGGELVDVRYEKNAFSFAFDIFSPTGDNRPVEDEDGIVAKEYAIRITPENKTLAGFILDRCSVSVEDNWSSAEGTIVKYTFDALLPKEGKMLKKYVEEAVSGVSVKASSVKITA
ncbi:MAG: hypothetical protein ACRCZB_04255 [Bacteroidales bacterium]